MVTLPSRYDARLALVGGITGVAGSYAVAGYTRSFVVAPIDALIVKATPGPIVTFMIERVGAEAHLIHIAMAFVAAGLIFGGFTLAGLRLAERRERRAAGALVGGLASWVAAAVLVGSPLLALASAVPVTVVVAAGAPREAAPNLDRSRRRALGTIAAGLGFAGLSIGAGSVLSRPDPLDPAPASEGVERRIEEAESRALDVASDELHGIVSEIDRFYNVDIAEFEPEIPRDEWSLTITGEVDDAALTVDFQALVEREVEHRVVTLRCVGENLNGHKLDTAVWTGVPIEPLIDEVDPNGECGCVVLRGDDGYFVEYPVDVLRSGFLAWGMNGMELPPQHGHPVRILAPGHWGETNVKWLTEIELLDEEMDGYWEQRGWRGTGEVNTVAKLWDEGITTLDDGRIELAGHAYAGTRGVQAVEVSTDGGDTWTEATLSEPLPDEDVWRMWRHRFEPSGTHEVVVRAIDGTGDVQTRQQSDSYPSGSTGWVRRTVTA